MSDPGDGQAGPGAERLEKVRATLRLIFAPHYTHACDAEAQAESLVPVISKLMEEAVSAALRASEAALAERTKERDAWMRDARLFNEQRSKAEKALEAARAEATKAVAERDAAYLLAGKWQAKAALRQALISQFNGKNEKLQRQIHFLSEELRQWELAAIHAPRQPEPDAFCVCRHPGYMHAPKDGVWACTIKDCACGPGCIHEGFVDRDSRIPNAPPSEEPRSTRRKHCAGSGQGLIPGDLVTSTQAFCHECGKLVRIARGSYVRHVPAVPSPEPAR